MENLPKQRNIGKYEFKMEGVDDIYAQDIRVIIEAPKYLDTSEIFVDIHPLWFQVIIKNKSLLLHLPNQIKVNESKVRRVICNGWLELILPKLHYKKRIKQQPQKQNNDNIKIEHKSNDFACDHPESDENEFDFDEEKFLL